MKKLFVVLALTAFTGVAFAQPKQASNKVEAKSTCSKKCGKTCAKKCTESNKSADCKQRKACCKKTK